jgi:hypothetical protein
MSYKEFQKVFFVIWVIGLIGMFLLAVALGLIGIV